MTKRRHSLLMSLYCSLMLSSAYLTVGKDLFYAGFGAAGANELGGTLHGAAAALAQDGWAAVSDVEVKNALAAVTPALGAPQVVPVAQTGQAAASGPLAAMADAILRDGSQANINGIISTAMGVTSQNAAFPAKKEAGENQTFAYASTVRGRTDIVLVTRTDNDGTFFLTGPNGTLDRAVHINKGEQPTELDKSIATVNLFNTQKDYWLKRTGAASVVQNP